MPFFEPGDEFFIILLVACSGALVYWVVGLLQSTSDSRTDFRIERIQQVESEMLTWDITVVNAGPATAENVDIRIREFDRSQLPLTESTLVHERDQWKAGEEVTLTYAIKESEAVWIHVDVSSYRFDHQFRLRQTALGDLIADDTRIS